MNELSAVVLAAGIGKRMKSDLPKVLFKVCGHSLIEHVLFNLEEAEIRDVAVVCGHGRDLVEEEVAGRAEIYVQQQQLGTGHAVMQAVPFIEKHPGFLAVLYGDAPLVDAQTLIDMKNYLSDNSFDMCVLTAVLEDGANYGRIIRDENGNFIKITEKKDCSQNELQIKEINSGTMMFRSELLLQYLPEIKDINSQHEYYLTDIVEIFKSHGKRVGAFVTENRDAVLGSNDRYELYLCENAYKRFINRRLMLSGVRMIDSETTYVDRNVTVGEGTVIYPNTVIRGKSFIGKNCTIYSSRIDDSVIGDDCIIDNSVLSGTKVGNGVNIGPFSHLRKDTVLCDHTKVGSFAETKNAVVGEGSKIPHLIYAGDAEIGKNVNLGCGVVTANYDGKNKHRTIIGDDCFIGCNTNLIAPITVGDNSFIAAGTTVSKDIEPDTFVIARPEEKRRDVRILRLKKK